MRQVGSQANRDGTGEDDRQQGRPVDEADGMGGQIGVLPAVVEIAEGCTERNGHATGQLLVRKRSAR